MKFENCRSCNARIIWGETNGGKAMPVDAAPDPNGNIILTEPVDARDPPVATVLKKGATGVRELRYTSHFATCPDASKWRAK